MSELAQTIVVVGILATAVGYLGARAWRKAAAARRAKPGCGPDCGCGH